MSTPLTPQDFAAVRVLVAGDAMLDRYWRGAVERISPEAPVPILRKTAEEDRPGGAANVAANVAALGAQASLWTALGDDPEGAQLCAMLQARGIQVHRHILPAPLRTTQKLRLIGQQQQLLRVDIENPRTAHPALACALPSAQAPAILQTQQVLLVSDYAKGALEQVGPLIASARTLGLQVLVDPKGHDFSRYRGAHVLTPNRSELQTAMGPWSNAAELEAKAQAARQAWDISALLLTRSEEGMSLFDDQGALHVPALAREVFDITGAGDTVVAVLAVLLGAGMPLRRAVWHANAAAAAVVGRLGTSCATLADLALDVEPQV